MEDKYLNVCVYDHFRMNKHNLSGLDYMVESYLSWRSSEGNIVTREDLNQWIVKNNTQVENIDEIGITLMDLEYGGTTPQQFEKFKKSFKFLRVMSKIRIHFKYKVSIIIL